jgi:hypothetical protein
MSFEYTIASPKATGTLGTLAHFRHFSHFYKKLAGSNFLGRIPKIQYANMEYI